MNYRWLVILACILVTACDSSTKEKAAKNVEKANPAETIVERPNPAEDLVSRYEAAYEEFINRIRSAAASERAEIAKTNPQAEFAEKFRALASENGDTEIEATALAWLASNSDKDDEKASALATMITNYPDSPAMKEAAGAMVAGKPSQATEDNLRRILENSPHPDVRGAAAFHLVSYLDRYKSLGEQVDELAENPNAVQFFGEDGIDYLRNLKVNDAEIEKLYETIVKDYSNVVISRMGRETNIGESAKNALFEIKYLSKGCVAPDIEGSDMDGKEFALSDYRGKVVMLDFWGDW